MKTHTVGFDEHEVLHNLTHYLPAQNPLKDFVHHNTLHAFQNKKFHEALLEASTIFGYKTYLSISDFIKSITADSGEASFAKLAISIDNTGSV